MQRVLCGGLRLRRVNRRHEVGREWRGPTRRWMPASVPAWSPQGGPRSAAARRRTCEAARARGSERQVAIRVGDARGRGAVGRN
ncbi:hypothetical protein [Oryza sativa Japonica Group]|uniref:Uncharacterized protein n=1 Tax=Oryza sativa subsp. japonica TaxID=39947 RepID=Q5QLF8_ORYSJ|nr:hypothetical protein [Oryza sativa Japonica Group]